MSKKTIAYIVSNPGSNDARVIKMAKASVEQGYNVHLFGISKAGFEPYEKIDGIVFHRIEWKPINILIEKYFTFKLIRRFNKRFAIYIGKKLLPYVKYQLLSSVIAEKIIELNPDLIHSHDLICLPTASNINKKTNIPYIYDAHELEIHRNPPLPLIEKKFVKYIEVKHTRNASRVITVGRYVANELKKHLYSSKIEVLYNSPIMEKSPYSLRDDLKVDKNKKILLYVGKVAMGRGIEDIIKILPILSPNIIFATVGPFDIKQKTILEKLAMRYEVTSRFFILPPVPYYQVVDYIKDASLGIISVQPVTLSYQYSMPNKLFELSFANVPIISNELDEINEFVDENKNGITVDINDFSSLAYNISKMMESTNLYKMSTEQYKKLSSNYSWNKQLDKLFNIYNDILS